MKIKLLKTKKEYNHAMLRLSEIFDTQKDSPQGIELQILGDLIEQYESKHYPIGAPDLDEAIQFKMEQMRTN